MSPYLVLFPLLSLLLSNQCSGASEKPDSGNSGTNEVSTDSDGVYILHENDFDDFLEKQVDATEESELGKRFEVQGYPTLKWFPGAGKRSPVDYDGPRDHAGIVTWLREKIDPNYKPPPSPVTVLTEENFDKWVAGKSIALVEFYAPWCGHCKKLEPEYEKAARSLAANDPPVHLAKVDATVEKDLGKRYGVSGYPTLKIMRNGRSFDYNGPRTAEGITDYMREQAAPAAKHFDKTKSLLKAFSKTDVTVVGFFADGQSANFEAFTEAAENLRDDFKTVLYVTEPGVMRDMKSEPDTVRIYYPDIWQSKFEPTFRDFSKDDFKKEDIVAFIEKECVPMVGHRTKTWLKRFEHKPLVVVYYTVDFSIEYNEGTQFWRKRVLEVANKYKNTPYRFAVSNEDEFQDELINAGLGDSGMEINVIAYGKDGKRYPWDPEIVDEDEFTVENFEKFMDMLKTNRIKPFIKSQPAPKDDKGPVKVVVAKNFNQIVLDETKDVLIEFYAPWCGHCKKFEPEYVKMAAELQSTEPNLVLAKMDATANDPQDNYGVQGFPTLYFAPKGRKQKPVQYNGNRDKNDLLKFMKEHGVLSFKGSEKEEL